MSTVKNILQEALEYYEADASSLRKKHDYYTEQARAALKNAEDIDIKVEEIKAQLAKMK